MNGQSLELSARFATAPNQPIDAIANSKNRKTGARDGSWCAVYAAIPPVGGGAALKNPVIG